jgi:phosphoribosylformimino-5-aminoimidazole carboxamide ribotide isomerase
MSLTLLPAIDVREGRAVRLLQGDYARETAYDDDPADAARRWADGGAEIVHVVDLDGARAGGPVNLETIERIAAAVPVPVQVGGGLRDEDAVAAVLGAGAARAVLGTRAQGDPDWVAGLAAEHGGERIVAAVDARRGKVAVEGWERATDSPVAELVERLAGGGVRHFVYTPVEVDGTLAGPGLAGIEAIAAAAAGEGGELIYSGGVGSLADLERLAGLGLRGLAGVIVGRALYEGRFTVAEAIAALANGQDGAGWGS